MQVGGFLFEGIGPVNCIRPLQNEAAGNFPVNCTNAEILRLGIGSKQFFRRQPFIRPDTVSLFPSPGRNLTHNGNGVFHFPKMNLYFFHDPCPSQFLSFTNPALHNFCPSQFLSLKIPILHNFCPSQFLFFTISALHDPCPDSCIPKLITAFFNSNAKLPHLPVPNSPCPERKT